MNDSQKLLSPLAPASLQRGVSPFAADVLHQAVAQLAEGASLAASDLAQYRAFYGFDTLLAGATHQLQTLEVAGETLAVHYFLPERAGGYAMLCHGYYDHVGLYGHVLQFLLANNIAVVAYDQIGHGLSTGARVNISSFDQYVRASEAVWQSACKVLSVPARQPWHWFGQSMGGAVVMETLHQHPQLPVAEVVLLAPLVRPYGWWYARLLFAVAKLTVAERPRTITRNAENGEFMALQHADPLQAQVLPVAWVQAMVDWFQRFEGYAASTLAPKIIQGHQDRTVSWRQSSRLLARRYAAAQWCILPEASHHLANESQALRQQMFSWLDAHCRWQSETESRTESNQGRGDV